MTIHLGDNSTLKEYNVAYFNFEWPIGNKSAIISFRIVPTGKDIVYNLNFEDGLHIFTESEDNILRLESSNDIINNDDIFS